ncbi:conserved hypothetical protein TIGR00250 [Luminiphilus syltensis NOR5-1B]|uniref:Putative pre-16S rRNA nuclease n=1 Tax=Luminiphilus syltensis NOR5-1B TaxID=565045 RepID=B8KU73_9GAMM|nr:Holliday junction resolvase RuvX [Luminiphilus syltensis]EED36681.1 conserved hypothetical protein TIGR00250 [Luminiphilus syltensis NOR5-1B]
MNDSPITVMGFDYGLRQIGVAIGNTLLGQGKPLAIVTARDGKPDWSQIERLIGEWQPDHLVVGKPLNMDGSDSEMGARAAKFSRQLNGRFAKPVDLVDERLTSREAKSQSRDRGHNGNYTTDPIDDEAAALILNTWFELHMPR